jgi:O-antigen ligase
MGIQLFCLGRFFHAGKDGSGKVRLFGIAAMALGAAATLASQTRTSAGYLLLIGGAFVLFTERSPARILGYQAAGVAALSLLALAIATDRAGAFGDAMATLADPLSDRRFLTRFHEAGEIGDAIGARAFRAYGMGAAGDTMDRYFPDPRVHFTTHNLALKLMIEMGMLGLAAFVAMLAAWAGRSIWSFWNRRRDPEPARIALACAALVLPVLAAGIIGTGIEAYPMNVLMWVGLGAVFAQGQNRA